MSCQCSLCSSGATAKARPAPTHQDIDHIQQQINRGIIVFEQLRAYQIHTSEATEKSHTGLAEVCSALSSELVLMNLGHAAEWLTMKLGYAEEFSAMKFTQTQEVSELKAEVFQLQRQGLEAPELNSQLQQKAPAAFAELAETMAELPQQGSEHAELKEAMAELQQQGSELAELKEAMVQLRQQAPELAELKEAMVQLRQQAPAVAEIKEAMVQLQQQAPAVAELKEALNAQQQVPTIAELQQLKEEVAAFKAQAEQRDDLSKRLEVQVAELIFDKVIFAREKRRQPQQQKESPPIPSSSPSGSSRKAPPPLPPPPPPVPPLAPAPKLLAYLKAKSANLREQSSNSSSSATPKERSPKRVSRH